MPDIAVVDEPTRSRYELFVDGKPAGHLRYRRTAEHLDLIHTEVDNGFEGLGLGARLVTGVLEDTRSRGGRIVASCPFVASYLKRHPEYTDLLADS